MALEHHVSRHGDGADTTHAKCFTGAASFGVDMTSPQFNRQIADAGKSETAKIHDMTITHGGSDRASGTPPVRNIDASAGFHQQVNESYQESFGRLNQQTQAKLQDSKVLTVNHTRKAMPGVPDVPAITPGMDEHKGNTMVFSEQGVKNQKAPIKDVMNHEIFHTVDNATGAAHDPELKRAIDKGIRNLSPTDQRHIAVHNREEAAQRYAEFAGDIMAMEMGSKSKDLAYVSKVNDPENNFREAREIMRKKYLK